MRGDRLLVYPSTETMEIRISTMEKEEICLGGCWIKDQLSYPDPSGAQCSQPTELLHRDLLRAFSRHI